MKSPKHILICRIDNIGDAILTFPVCGVIKKYYPDCKISFLGRSYTRDTISICEHINGFLNYDELKELSVTERRKFFNDQQIDTAILLHVHLELARFVRSAGIKKRVGSARDLHHWRTCNKLAFFSKKAGKMHMTEINLKFLKGIGIHEHIPFQNFPDYLGVTKIVVLNEMYRSLLSTNKFNLILHPRAKNHAQQWSLERYAELIRRLDKNRFHIMISGAKEDREGMLDWLTEHEKNITDISGKFSIDQFISFISHADGLMSGSTGPVHIAAATGIHALGLFPDHKAANMARWFPVGKKAEGIECTNADMNTISVEMVLEKINDWK
ncbi:MAG TPA: glycosyltransferase family 9 protein [Chitinophagaceae bacterium]|nr:glycosyltransferase family 9 protein [Chitinophagaceae bacterium]